MSTDVTFDLKALADMAVDALLADPFFAAIPAYGGAVVVSFDSGDIDSTIAQDLNKIGLNVTVMVNEALATNPDARGPYFDDIGLVAVVTEETVTNRAAANPTAYAACMAAAAILHQASIDGSPIFQIARVARVLNPPEGQNVWNIFFKTQAGLGYQRPVIAPVTAATTDNGDGTFAVVLKCATPGAPIWFTTDGTYPVPLNPAAQLYLPYAAVMGTDLSGNPVVSSDGGVLIATDIATVQPLTIAAGTKVTARAWLAGYAPANPPQLNLTI